RGSAERAVIETGDDVGFVLQAATAGIDQHGRAERTVAVHLAEQTAIENVPRARRQWQQADQDVGPLEKRVELLPPGKTLDTIDLLFAAAPAHDLEPDTLQDVGGVRAEHAQSHDADGDRACRPLISGRPAPGALR